MTETEPQVTTGRAPPCCTGRSAESLGSAPANPCFIDPETGLPTARLFRDRLERAWITLTRTNGIVGVAQIQIGCSPAGGGARDPLPLVRRTIADRARRAMRETDSLAFLEAERLCWLVPQAHSLAGVRAAVTRLLQAMDGPVAFDEGKISLALRAGIAVGRPPDLGVEALLQQATDALRQAAPSDAALAVASASFADGQAGLEGPQGPHSAAHASDAQPSGHGDAPCLTCLAEPTPPSAPSIEPAALRSKPPQGATPAPLPARALARALAPPGYTSTPRRRVEGVAHWDDWVRRRSR